MSLRVLVAGLSAALLVGCVGPSSPVVTSAAPTGAETKTSVTVLAASSLKNAFTGIAKAYMDAHPGVEVTLQFAGSADLLAQIAAGAPGDVLATADEATMTKAVTAKLVGENRPFAHNRLTIVTQPGNPKGIKTAADLTRPGILLVVCAPVVPCGSAAATLARRAGVTFAPISEESKVTDVVAKVDSGSADAGLVYHTDAIASRLSEVPLEGALAVRTTDMIAAVAGSQTGADFAEFVLGSWAATP